MLKFLKQRRNRKAIEHVPAALMAAGIGEETAKAIANICMIGGIIIPVYRVPGESEPYCFAAIVHNPSTPAQDLVRCRDYAMETMKHLTVDELQMEHARQERRLDPVTGKES